MLQINHISSKWHRQATGSAGPTPSRGLDNPGTLCYRNSIIQALLHAPKFVYWLENSRHDCTVRKCVACALRALCIRYWDEPLNQSALDQAMRHFRQAVGDTNSKLKGQIVAPDLLMRSNSISRYRLELELAT